MKRQNAELYVKRISGYHLPGRPYRSVEQFAGDDSAQISIVAPGNYAIEIYTEEGWYLLNQVLNSWKIKTALGGQA